MLVSLLNDCYCLVDEQQRRTSIKRINLSGSSYINKMSLLNIIIFRFITLYSGILVPWDFLKIVLLVDEFADVNSKDQLKKTNNESALCQIVMMVGVILLF